MPEPNEAVPSSRVKLFVLPNDGTDPIPVGLVEDYSGQKVIASENFRVIGSGVVPDNVSNIEEGRVRWTKVHNVDPEFLRVITPRIREWTAWRPFNLLALDPETNAPISLAIGVRPESVDINARGGAAMRQSYNGLCRYVLSDDEVREAAA